MKITVSKNTAGLPPTRMSRMAQPKPRHLQATVYRTDGTAYTERTERDDEIGRKEMDRWAFERNLSPNVDFIKVERVEGRIAGYKRSR